MKGLEPPRLAASDPKSDASTNFATSAKNRPYLGGANILLFWIDHLEINLMPKVLEW